MVNSVSGETFCEYERSGRSEISGRSPVSRKIVSRVVDVRREANGYSIMCRQPKLDNSDDEVDYSFTVWSVQPKNVTSFPFIVSEPERDPLCQTM